MLHPKSSCVCIPCIKPVTPTVCHAKVPFLAFFLAQYEFRYGCGHIHILKHSPDSTDSKYIYMGSSV